MPGIDYTLGMNTSGFKSGASEAMSKLANLGTAVANITANAGLAAGKGIAAFVAKSIGKAAEMEDLEAAFVPLLGSIEKAKERIADLAEFSDSTPFDLPEVASASKVLETLTKGALSTGTGLTLVGDVAKATGADFSEVSTTIGRLYAGLTEGGEIGEATQRLTELGAMSFTTKTQLEALRKEGQKGPEVWKVAADALHTFDGGMKLGSITWTGLMNTFQDSIARTMATFGQPIMDSLKPYLEAATARMESYRAAAARIGEQLGEVFREMKAAFEQGTFIDVSIKALKLGFMEAVNLLARGVQATMAVIWDSKGVKNLVEILGNVGISIGASITTAILRGTDGLLGIVDNKKKIQGWEGVGKAYLSLASAQFENFSFGNNIEDAGKLWQDKFKNAPDYLNTSATRDELNTMRAPLITAAEKDRKEADRRKQAIADEISRNNARNSDPFYVEPDPFEMRPRTAPPIGDYVGNASSGQSSAVLTKTEQWTRETAIACQALLSRLTGSNNAVLEF